MADRIYTRADWALMLVRLVTGLVFVMHGGQKFFDTGIEGVTGFFTQMGIPLPGVSAVVVAVVEFVGGLALLLGLATRWVAIPLAITMIVAILKVHVPNGFFNPMGVEFPLTLLFNLIALAIAGGGAYALDSLLFGRRRSS